MDEDQEEKSLSLSRPKRLKMDAADSSQPMITSTCSSITHHKMTPHLFPTFQSLWIYFGFSRFGSLKVRIAPKRRQPRSTTISHNKTISVPMQSPIDGVLAGRSGDIPKLR